ncbi:hypothetical protein HPB52_000756 [Rhipicephalus sanguineus]|uniref:Reverse transcriptase domain-containing protein n=1 Tax=Rhipicephalus sanguineus TaxID=34632 RepID=A0A9D4SP49_RHISA|nr:hypothetical protein HPB52_000756 [Rhipicephalus sanguineus]
MRVLQKLFLDTTTDMEDVRLSRTCRETVLRRRGPQCISSNGTPQGSVISPMLFNLVMLDLAQQLQQVDNIHHTIYADDITIWACQGSDGQVESALQTAIDTVEAYLQGTGLRCSPAKSELLLYKPIQRGRPPQAPT